MSPPGTALLKSDLFGRMLRLSERGQCVVVRDVLAARRGLGWLARRLAAREARALEALAGLHGTPRLLSAGRWGLQREWLDARPMQQARPADPAYFHAALRLVIALHRRGVAHNDLAKEPNWLVTPNGQPALVDFQLAVFDPHRGRLWRLMAREDLRHLLKHKRTYCPERLTRRQRRMLETPSWPSRAWRLSGKPLYLFITRRLLGWADREGAGDRNLR